jgi:hypothetical protein
VSVDAHGWLAPLRQEAGCGNANQLCPLGNSNLAPPSKMLRSRAVRTADHLFGRARLRESGLPRHGARRRLRRNVGPSRNSFGRHGVNKREGLHMKTAIGLCAAALLLAGSGELFAQAAKNAEQATENTKARAKSAMSDKDVTYGRIKELTAGQKVVINVDNAIDKSFDLSDKDLRVTLAKGLKVGDPVKVQEHEVAGKTKSVTITKHSGGGVQHGDPKPVTK